jgi:hypothetical protein
MRGPAFAFEFQLDRPGVRHGRTHRSILRKSSRQAHEHRERRATACAVPNFNRPRGGKCQRETKPSELRQTYRADRHSVNATPCGKRPTGVTRVPGGALENHFLLRAGASRSGFGAWHGRAENLAVYCWASCTIHRRDGGESASADDPLDRATGAIRRTTAPARRPIR